MSNEATKYDDSKLSFLQTKKKQAYSFSLFTLAVILILIVGAIVPSVSTIITIRKEIDEKETVLAKLEQKSTNLDQLEDVFPSIEGVYSDLSLVFPAKGDYSLFLSNIEGVSNNYGFELVNVGFGEGRGSGGDAIFNSELLAPVPVTLSVRGDQETVVEYINALEDLPFYPTITSFNYSNVEDEDGNITYSINMVVYEVSNVNYYGDNSDG